MASQERLEYFISAAFKDEGVRQAMQAFAKLNAESAKVVNELDRMSQAGQRAGQAIRDSRTPYAQVGMQINQLGTQLAGGTSFATAFAQQIGDVGWALQNANGTLGVVGRFLAGPWGAAVAIAASVLGPFITNLIGASDATKRLEQAQTDGKKAIESYGASLSTLKGLQEQYAIMTAKSIDSEINLRKQYYETAKAALVSAQNQLTAVETVLFAKRAAYIDARKIHDEQVQMALDLGDAEAAGIINIIDTTNETKKRNAAIVAETAVSQALAEVAKQRVNVQTRLNELTGAQIQQSHENERAAKSEAKAAETLQNKRESLINTIQNQINIFTAEETSIGKAKNKLKDFNAALDELNKIGSGGFLIKHADEIKKVQEALAAGANGTTFAIEELDKLDKKINDMSEKNIDPVKKLRNELNALVASISSGTIVGKDLDAVTEKINKVSDALNNLQIKKKNDEYIKSFDAVGQSVSDAFKGMLTSGMSWKDGMKGIINAVIDQLWQLFVVQQITGMIKNVLGKVFKIPIPGNANGTPSWQGGMTWVGERGPELVNLPRGSQVIPAHRASQMGTGGGVTVNVDARGSSDPAAVRAQVQQGILAAAPAIVSAAQQRTMAGLRRPKLGGVIQ